MLGGIYTDLLVAVTLLFLTQTRAENDMSLVTLPDWRKNSEYISQCFYDRHNHLVCDWTNVHPRTEDVPVNILESGALDQGEACLEFWYLPPVVADGSGVQALLKNSTGLVEIWTSPSESRSSWIQVFVPLYIIEPGTQVVLEAVQATEGQVTFKRIGIRRGSCGRQCESDTELWTDESTRCLCSAGQLHCSPAQCPKGQICGPESRLSRGVSTSGTCTVHGDTDCSTFDGELFRFMAPCTYTLAKTCSPTETLPVFSVEVINEHNGNSSLPTVQRVTVEIDKFRVSLLKRQTHRVVVGGIWKRLPLSLGNGTVNIKSNPASVVLGTNFGLLVSYDNAGAVHVTLPSTYTDQVCGLCGNFNNVRGDDFREPDGTDARDATGLAKSWQTEESTSSCETILVPHQCDPQEEVVYASELNCGGLLSATGPFAACLSVLEAESYFRGCVAGMCSNHGDPGVLCETLEIYASICQEAGVVVPTWRNSTFCPLQCGENSHFNSCAEGCPDVCHSLDLPRSCGSCEERCECDSGFKLSGGKCVPVEDCGCWYSGKHYEKGETFLEGECKEHCQCMGSNNVQCITMQCANDEVCKVKDGVKGCFSFQPATCRVYGDPHYITFDGLAYDFQGGCSYILTTTNGSESPVPFTVTGHNMHPPFQNLTRSKLEAVSLQVEDLYLTLNQSGAVYMNKSQVQLPLSTNTTYGSVWVYKENGYIYLVTTFGLRMAIDGQNRLFLQVDELYMHELRGLCGTYSKDQRDDFLKPGDVNATEPFEFGDSWRVSDKNECTAYPNNPRPCDSDEKLEAINVCSTISGDAFKPCHALHPGSYLNSCLYDYCATGGDQYTLCESLKSYAAACQFAGVELPDWQTGTVCAELPTTTPVPTTTTPTTPTPAQSFCPMNCDFENNLCGWEQLVQDTFDWTRHSGSTPTSLSGPNQDHTTGAGFYIYLEGDSITHGDSARLLSAQCHYSGPLCLQFWYHMHGSATAMAINIYLLKDNKATKRWSIMNNQGPEWHQGNIDIRDSGPFQIIIEGIRGSNHESDVAIDDISIKFGSCSGSVPRMISGTNSPPITAAIPSLPVCNLDCSFDSTLCSWDQMITDAFDWTWQSGSTPTLMTGPSADHTGDGHYLYIEASSVTYGDTARLMSSECPVSGPQCLQFWYHMYGSADTMGIRVYLVQNKKAVAVWSKRNDQGNMWHLAQVDMTTTGSFQIIFEGRRGSNDQSDVAIDDVSLHRGHCAELDEKPSPAPVTVNPVTTDRPSPTTTTSSPVTHAPTTSPPTTTIFETTTTACDTQTPKPTTTTVIPTTANPDVPTKPQQPITSKPLTTARPQRPTTEQPQPPTTAQPQSQTTVRPQPPTTAQQKPQTTVKPQPPTTSQPHPVTTDRPSPTTTTSPPVTHVTTTSPPTTTTACDTQTPKPTTTVITTTGNPDVTTRPQQPITSKPLTTARPQRPTTAQPQPPTTVRPQPPTTAQPQPPTTAQPQPPTTTQPKPQTTVRPQPPSTDRPQPPTATQAKPQTTAPSQPTTTAGPQPTTTTTNKPQPTTSTPQTTTARPKPPTTPIPTPSCPKNSHYTTCMSACSPTCIHLDGPPNCSDNEACIPGCACDDGYVLKQRVCVPIQQCGCMDRDGTKYKFNEEWYTNHCTQKCECEKHNGIGRIDCDDEEECDGNAVCLQNDKGHFYCQSTGFSECTIKGDPEYKTFDKVKHDFAGEHSYVLVRTNNLPNNFPDVYIEGISEQIVDDEDDDQHPDDHSSEEKHSHSVRDDEDDDDDSDGDDDDEPDDDDEHHRLQELKIRVYNHTVEFKKNRKLVLDGRRTKTPVSPTAGLSIRKSSSRIYLKTDFGLSVRFDGRSRAEIILPRIYRGKVRGLCGNFDDRRNNDLMKPDGTLARTIQEFGESWRV